jgi:hypothetical protein
MQVLTPAPRPSPQVAAETELGRLLKEQRAHYESMIHQLKHEYERLGTCSPLLITSDRT